ncbi:GNAT family N-acetyltransferase [Shouchella lehensis]|uniref:GNAT family N-acetyltransferase n=1 Tax=Shouchella lehensis TaxID=300825 RepID=A0A4Y7WMC5_9BACI|nr:GNAT family N-acetyltransferase [Shouchella lehensis]MBG9782822.1 GNAT family acetyltraansferase [Shouchella lehensis]TES49836.1 GNAT family N-acetyltransferase [Shouchella lehensis]
MIRQLDMNDQDICLDFVKKKPAENLFIIGDIEAYGMETDFQTVWGEFNRDNQLVAVLLKFHTSYVPFAEGSYDAKGFAEIINKDSSFKGLSGLKDVTEQLEPYLKKSLLKRQMYYAKCARTKSENAPSLEKVQTAQPQDAAELLMMLDQIPEFSQSIPKTAEQKQRELATGFSRACFVRQDDKIVSSASTTAENTHSAMIVGVATLEDYKRNGYASACVHHLCEQLFTEGKEACLFYDNLSAGVIYKHIGFEDIGLWMMYNEKSEA